MRATEARNGQRSGMRAVIADEWSVLRGGVAVVLSVAGIATQHQAATATAAISQLHPGGPEVLVLGLVNDQTLLRAVQGAKAACPDVHVIVLVPVPDRATVMELLDSGAGAVLTRTAGEPELHDALDRVQRGERFIAPGLLSQLFGDAAPAPVAGPSDRQALTEKERNVLGLLVEGLSNREIADALFIGEATVKTHLHNVYAKLKVQNRVQAVSRAMEMRILS